MGVSTLEGPGPSLFGQGVLKKQSGQKSLAQSTSHSGLLRHSQPRRLSLSFSRHTWTHGQRGRRSSLVQCRAAPRPTPGRRANIPPVSLRRQLSAVRGSPPCHCCAIAFAPPWSPMPGADVPLPLSGTPQPQRDVASCVSLWSRDFSFFWKKNDKGMCFLAPAFC